MTIPRCFPLTISLISRSPSTFSYKIYPGSLKIKSWLLPFFGEIAENVGCALAQTFLNTNIPAKVYMTVLLY
jgi:hypothetical protein